MKNTNRFKGTLNKHHGVKLMDFRFNGRQYEVRATEHSLQRFIERKLNVDEALGSIVALGKSRLDYFANVGADVAIIDKIQHQTVIITFESEDDYTQIRIATVIPRSRVFVKDGTKIYNLKEYKEGF
jgi:hypothetical protein